MDSPTSRCTHYSRTLAGAWHLALGIVRGIASVRNKSPTEHPRIAYLNAVPTLPSQMAFTGNIFAHQYTQPASWPLLPFLYQTRTLRTQAFSRPQKQPKQQRSCRSLSTTKRSLAALDETTDNNAIPFESPGWSQDEGRGVEARRILINVAPPPRPSRDTTITASEQAIFDRIFADIASSKRATSEHNVDEDDEVAAESFEDLNSIFDNAMKDLQRRTESYEQRKATKKVIEWTPVVQDIPTLSSYSTELLDKAGWGQPGKIGSDDVSDLAEAHKQHRTKIECMLASAQTDLEVWQVLEKEVFSLVHELNARIKVAEKNKSKKKPKKEKPKTASSSARRPSKTEELRQEFTPASLPPTVLLSILQTEYPQYLVQISRLLREYFPSSPYPLNLLPAIRRLGTASHVLGASTALYNETILLLWNQEPDLHAMADLLDEMAKEGVESNEVTVAFLKGIRNIRTRKLTGKGGAWQRMWWRMGSIEEGWQRVAASLERCQREVKVKENLREREMAEEMEGEEENREETDSEKQELEVV